MTVHLQLSALPLATRPLATAHPCHVRPTHQPSVSPGTQQRPTSPNSASGEHEKPLRGRLALSPGRWRIVRKCKSHRCTAVVRTAIQLCSRCGLAGTYCSNAVVLLWWWVGSWVGGGCLVGDGSLTTWCVLPYSCAPVVDWPVRTAPMLLYCCGGGLVRG